MAIRVTCGGCDRLYTLQDVHAGRTFRCNDCGESVKVPGGRKAEVDFDGDDDEFDERPLRRNSGARSPQKNRRRSRRAQQPLYWVIGGAAGLVAFVIAFFAVRGRNEPPPHQPPAMNPAVAPWEGGNPVANRPPDADPYAAHFYVPQRFTPDGISLAHQPETLFDLAAIPIPEFADPHRFTVPGNPEIVAFESQGMPTSPESAQTPATFTRLKLFLPPGEHAAGSLGCVFVGPAGTNLITGCDIDPTDAGMSPEHLPYVQDGFAVVTFSLDGPIANRETATDRDYMEAYKHFSRSYAGLLNARNAVEFVQQRVPQVDPNRLYIAGHSSAAALALLFAEHEPRLKGCIAFAPATDLREHLAELLSQPVAATAFPQIFAFTVQASPRNHTGDLKCPAFVFHARDDTVAKFTNSREIVDMFKNAGKLAVYVEHPSGGITTR